MRAEIDCVFGLLSDLTVRVRPREGARAFAGSGLARGANVYSGVWVFLLLVGNVNSIFSPAGGRAS